MSNHQRILLTVITEASLEAVLIKEVERLGARGYTITDARGKGSRGTRSAKWDADKNIRMEIVCNETVAKNIESHLQEKYYDNFAMIIFSTAVNVLRPEKF